MLKQLSTKLCRAFAALTLLFCLGAPAAYAAESQKIAVVNLEKIFMEYKRSRVVEDSLKEQAEKHRAHMVRQNNQLIQLRRDYEQQQDKALNLAHSEADRNQFAAEAIATGQAVTRLEMDMKRYAQEQSEAMIRLERELRENIMQDIYREIDRRALAEGFGFVLDYSGKTLHEQPTVLRFPASCDLTDAVIRELNRGQTTPTAGQ